MTVVVSIHDVHATTGERSLELLDMVRRRRIRATVLVVPGPWRGRPLDDDPALIDRLSAAAADGYELALHGWRHEPNDPTSARNARNRVMARGCAEFCDLDLAAARDLIARGVEEMERHGWSPIGFTPPGWLASGDAVDALYEAGFAYTTSHLTVTDLWLDREIRIPAICQRPASSLAGVGSWFARHVLVRHVVQQRPIRLALHPADLDDPRTRDATIATLDIAACRPTASYADLLDLPVGLVA